MKPCFLHISIYFCPGVCLSDKKYKHDTAAMVIWFAASHEDTPRSTPNIIYFLNDHQWWHCDLHDKVRRLPYPNTGHVSRTWILKYCHTVVNVSSLMLIVEFQVYIPILTNSDGNSATPMGECIASCMKGAAPVSLFFHNFSQKFWASMSPTMLSWEMVSSFDVGDNQLLCVRLVGIAPACA